MLSLLTLAAFAEAPDDDAVRAALSKAKGKEVPAKFVCIERPELAEPFVAPVTAAAIKVKGKGCVLQGVFVDDRFLPALEALPAAVGTNWPTLKGEERANVLSTWTRSVLDAFVQSDGKVITEGDRVTHPVLRRSGESMVGERAVLVYTFGADGKASVETSETARTHTKLVLRTVAAKGVSKEQVTQGISTVGKLFERCFQAAWQSDLSMNERTRMGWDIVDGKATGVKVRQQFDGRLTQCYANVLSRATFEADGTAEVEFGVRRTPVE